MLENKVRVQVGLPVSELDVRSDGFKNFVARVDECVKNNEWDYGKLNFTYSYDVDNMLGVLTFDRDLKDFTYSKYEQVLINAFEEFKDIFGVYPKLYTDGEEFDFIVPVQHLITPLNNTYLNIDKDKPFGIDYFYDHRKQKMMVSSDIYALMRKPASGSNTGLHMIVDRDRAYDQLNVKDPDEVECWLKKLKLDLYE